MNGLRYLPNVTTLALETARCNGCGTCVQVCPHAVFRLRDVNGGDAGSKAVNKARVAELADRDACMECGACSRNCPTGALSVHPGVGCASAILTGWLRGTEPDCGDGCCGTGSGTGGSACC